MQRRAGQCAPTARARTREATGRGLQGTRERRDDDELQVAQVRLHLPVELGNLRLALCVQLRVDHAPVLDGRVVRALTVADEENALLVRTERLALA